MSGQTSQGTTTVPAGGRWWVLSVVIGAVSVLIGILMLAWPSRTLLIVAVLFGIELVVLGIIRTAAAIAVPMSRNLRILGLVLGVLTILAGVFCFINPGTSLLVLAIFFAAGFIADGIGELAKVKTAGLSGRARLGTVLSGVISIIAGIVVAAIPGASLVLLVQLSGVVLIVLGIIQIAIGAAARAKTTAPPTSPPATPSSTTAPTA